jgi:tRNA A37 threonylcarbamoyladenosine modification protein TsaB
MRIPAKYMLKIYIDASERKNKLVKLINESKDSTKIVAEKSGDIDIVMAIKNIINENNFKIDQIELFEFAEGKGSFTGIKMAATIANVLQWAINNVPTEKLKMPDYGGEPNIQKNS